MSLQRGLAQTGTDKVFQEEIEALTLCKSTETGSILSAVSGERVLEFGDFARPKCRDPVRSSLIFPEYYLSTAWPFTNWNFLSPSHFCSSTKMDLLRCTHCTRITGAFLFERNTKGGGAGDTEQCFHAARKPKACVFRTKTCVGRL